MLPFRKRLCLIVVAAFLLCTPRALAWAWDFSSTAQMNVWVTAHGDFNRNSVQGGSTQSVYITADTEGHQWWRLDWVWFNGNAVVSYWPSTHWEGWVSFTVPTTPGNYTFTVQCLDGRGCWSQLLSVPYTVNAPPTTTWAAPPLPNPLYTGMWFPVRATGHDTDNNLCGIMVEVRVNGGGWEALAYDPAGANGGDRSHTTSNNNGVLAGPPGTTYQFRCAAWDQSNAFSPWDEGPVLVVANRPPTVLLSAPGLGAAGGGQQVDASLPNGSTISFTNSAADQDGNLTRIRTWINFSNQGWVLVRDDANANSAWSYSLNGIGTYQIHSRSLDASGAESATAIFNVTATNRPPTGVFTINGGASNATIEFGQAVDIASTVTDPDSNLTVHSFLWDQGLGLTWTHPVRNWDYPPNALGWFNQNLGANGHDVSGGSSTRSFSFRAARAGVFAFQSKVADRFVSFSVGPPSLSVTVNPVTPVVTGWSDRTRTGSGAFANAFDVSLTNPHDPAVAAPTGGMSFTLLGASGNGASPTTGSVNASSLFQPGTYTVRGSYVGDANYRATTRDVTFTVQNVLPALTMAANGAASATLTYGQTATIAAIGADSDGNLNHVGWVRSQGSNYFRPGGADLTRAGWSGYPADAGYYTAQSFTDDAASGPGPVTKSAVFRPPSVGTFYFLGRAGDGWGQSSGSASVVVSPAPLTITAANATRAYNQANPAFTFSVSGMVNGELASVATGINLATTATATCSPGVYPITPSGGTATNYTLSYVAGTLTITPGDQEPLSVQASLTQVYGTTQTLATSGGSGAGAVSYAIVGRSSPSVASISGAGLRAESGSGWVDIQATKAADTNYSAKSSPVVRITFQKAPLTIRGPIVSRHYSLTNPAWVPTYLGLTNGDTSSVVTGLSLVTTATAASPVGDYPVVLSGATAANYTITLIDGLLTVTRLPVSFTFGTRFFFFDSTAPTAVYAPGIIAPPGVTYQIRLDAPPAAGDTASDASSSTPGGYHFHVDATGNYIGTNRCDWGIYCCEATITLLGTPRIYNGLPQAPAATSNAPAGTVMAFSYRDAVTHNSIPPPSAAGTYEFTAFVIDNEPDNVYGGYGGFKDGSFVIQPAPLAVKANDFTRSYGASNPSLTSTITGFVNGETSAVLSGSPALSTSATVLSGVGTYPINIAQGTLAAANYSFAAFTAGTLTIIPAVVPTSTTVAVIPPLVYSPVAQNLSVTATVNGSPNPSAGTVTFTLKSPAGVPLATATGAVAGGTATATLVIPAGTPAVAAPGYTVSASFEEVVAGNYRWQASSAIGAAFKIDKATPTITWSTPVAIVYGAALSGAQLNATVPGIAGSFVYAPASGSVLAAGSHPLSVTFTPTDAANYTTATKSVTLTVDPVSVPTSLTVASVGSLTYSPSPQTIAVSTTVSGSPTPSGNVTFSLKTAGGATVATTTGTLVTGSVGATLTVPGGTNAAAGYVIAVHYAQTTAGNYAWQASSGNSAAFAILRAVPVVTWANPATIVYGTALTGAQLNGTVSVPGSTVYTPAAGTVLNAGPQTLRLDFTPTDATNYTSASGTVSLTVDKAAQPSLVLAGTSPQVYGTTQSLVLSGGAGDGAVVLSVSPGSPATLTGMSLLATSGTGTVNVQATKAGSANYLPATANTLTIMLAKAVATLTLSDMSRVYDGAGKSPSVTTVPAGLALSLSYAGQSPSPTEAGSYAFSAVVNDANYQGSASGTFVIQPAPQFVAISPPAPEADYGRSLTLTASGGVTGYIWSGAASGSGDMKTLSPSSAGNQTVTVYSPAAGNYARSNDASVTVTVRKVTPVGTFAPKTLNAPYSLSGTDLTATFVHPFNGGTIPPSAGAISYSPAPGTTLAPGSHTITATFAGDANYLPASVSATFVVNRITPTVTWAPAAMVYGATFSEAQRNAVAMANGVNITAQGRFDYTPADGVRMRTVGPRSMTARFAPNNPDLYNSAEAIATVTVERAPQSISFVLPESATYGASPMILAARADSGLPVVFTLGAGSPATLAGSTLTITGAGTITVTASCAESGNYLAAPSVTRTMNVDLARQRISFTHPATIGFQLDAVANSGLPVSYALSSTGQAQSRPEEFLVIGNTLVYTGNSVNISVRVTASQPGDGTRYAAATPVSYDVTTGTLGWISRPASVVPVVVGSFPLRYVVQNYWQGGAAPPSGLRPVALFVQEPSGVWRSNPVGFGIGPWNDKVMASGSLELPTPGLWRIKVVSGSTVDSPLVAIDPGGATQPILEINVTNQAVITFGNPGTQVLPFSYNLNATSTSSQPITYTVTGPATLSGTLLTATGPGLISVTASQAAGGGFLAARSVTQSFNVVTKPRLTIDSITPPSTGGGHLTGSGWALDYYDGAPISVKLFIDGQERPGVFTTVARSDVQDVSAANGWSIKEVTSSGWTMQFNTSELDPETHTVELRAANNLGHTTSQVWGSFSGGKPQLPRAVITWDALPGRPLGAPPFPLFATSSSGAPVTFELVSGPATLSGPNNSLVTLGSTSGVVTIRARSVGDSQYLPPFDEVRSFTLGAADSDGDGVDDQVEIAWNLNPGNSADAASIAPNGLSYLENYKVWGSPSLPLPSATQIPVNLTVIGKPSAANATVTVTMDGQTYTFGFGGTGFGVGEWQGANADVANIKVTSARIDAELGRPYPLQVSSVNMTDFAVRVKETPDVSPSLQVVLEFDRKYIEAIGKAELAAQGGTTTLIASRAGIVPFGVLDMARFETSRMLTFGLGGSRSGDTAGQIVLTSSQFIYGGSGQLRLLKGPALVNAWEKASEPSHFQAQAPSGYVDVVRTRPSTTIRYFAQGSYPVVNGYLDFSGATPLAIYVIDGILGGLNGSLTRTIGGVTMKYECEFERGEVVEGDTYSGTGTQQVHIVATTYYATARLWNWRLPTAARGGVTVAKATTLRTARTPVQGGPTLYDYNPFNLTITRYFAATEEGVVASTEERNYLDGQLVNSTAVRRGDQDFEGRVPSPGGGLAIGNIETKNGKGGGTLTEHYSMGYTLGAPGNLDGQPNFILGEIKSIRRSVGDGSATDVNDASALVSRYTYKSAPVDGRNAPATVITKQGAVTVNSVSYDYSEGSFGGLPTVQTTITSRANSTSTLVKTVKAFSRRVADLDRREKPLSSLEADGTQVSYAYQRGSLADDTWTADSNGSFLLVAQLNGKAGTTVSSYPDTGSPIEPLAMDSGRSTVSEQIYDSQGRLVREAAYVYNGSGFTRLSAVTQTFDALGNLLAKTDSSSRVLYEANVTGFRKNWDKDEQGITRTYTYDDYDRIKTVTRAGATDGLNTIAATVTTFAYDAVGRLSSEVVAAPNTIETDTLTTEYTYDLADRPKTRTQPGAFTTTLAYTPSTSTSGPVETATLPGGGTKVTTYYKDGRVKSVNGTSVPDTTTTFSYDATTGFLKTVETTGGQSATTTADWLGRTVSVETTTFNGTTRTTSNAYDSLGRLQSQDTKTGTVKLTPTRLYAYDDYSRLSREALDANGNGQIDPSLDFDVKEYESSFQTGVPGDLANVYRYEAQLIWPYAGAKAGTSRYAAQTYAQVTGLGASTVSHSITVDLDRNRTESTTTVDRANKKVAVATTATGTSATLLQERLNGLAIKTTNAQGQVTLMTYDALGRLESSNDPRIGSTTFYYKTNTALVESTTAPDKQTTAFGYDTAGNVVQKTQLLNGVQKHARFRYNFAGQMTHQWGDAVNPARFGYNDLGQREKMHTYRSGAWTGADLPAGFGTEGDVTVWKYQAATGLLETKTDAAGETTTYSYNDLGQVSKRTDARGWVTNYTYNALNLPETTDYVDNVTTDVVRTYDRAGKLIAVDDAAGQRTFGYYETWSDNTYENDLKNKSARLAGETLPAYLGSHTIGYDYQYGVSGQMNGALNGLKLDTGSLYQVSYAYDGVLRLASVGYNTSAVFGYSYVPNGNLIDTVTQAASGTQAGFTRDYDYEETSHRLAKLTQTTTAGGTQTLETRLKYDTLGRRQTEKTHGEAWRTLLGRSAPGTHVDYSYTDRSEVSSSAKYMLASGWELPAAAVMVAQTDRDFDYDAMGNRVSETVAGVAGTYTPNALNQYTALPGAGAVSYDKNGNLLGDGTRTYAYDGENRLISVTQGGASWTYVYDYLGRRIAKRGTGLAERRYVYDGWNLIAELDSAGTIVRRHVWGLDVSGSLQGAGGVGGLLLSDDGVQLLRVAYDASHNVIGLYGESGTLRVVYDYDPFGGHVRAGEATLGAGFPFRYSTKMTDDETGLTYYGHRYYSAKLGRFINRDPIEESGGLNLYGFCGNDGVNRWDLLGMVDIFDRIFRTGGGFAGDRSDNPTNSYGSSGDEIDKKEAQAAAKTADGPFTAKIGHFDMRLRPDGENWNLRGMKESVQNWWTLHDLEIQENLSPGSQRQGFWWSSIVRGLTSGGTREDAEIRQAVATSRFLGNVAYGATIGTATSAKSNWDAGNAAYLRGDHTLMFLHSLEALGDIASLGLLAKWAYSGLRSSLSSAAENVVSQGGRLGGELVNDATLARVEVILAKNNSRIIRNADEVLDSMGAGAAFRAYSNGSSELLLRSNVTRYDLFHELKHFGDFNRLGFDAYKALGSLGREESVFYYMARQNWLNPREGNHAWEYISRLRK